MHAGENDAEYFILAHILEKILAGFFYNETTHLQSLSLIYQSIYFMNDEVLVWSGIRTVSVCSFSNGENSGQTCMKKFGDLQVICKPSFQVGLAKYSFCQKKRAV